jgi:hypothetical protein
MGIIPEWHKSLFPRLVGFKKMSGLLHVRQFAGERLEAKYEKVFQPGESSVDAAAPVDLITKLLSLTSSCRDADLSRTSCSSPECSSVLLRDALAASGWRVSARDTAGKRLPSVVAERKRRTGNCWHPLLNEVSI